ncbi:unnamed protein product [Arctogadus glacialis]
MVVAGAVVPATSSARTPRGTRTVLPVRVTAVFPVGAVDAGLEALDSTRDGGSRLPGLEALDSTRAGGSRLYQGWRLWTLPGLEALVSTRAGGSRLPGLEALDSTRAGGSSLYQGWRL